jgi:hypothetical protein
LLYRLMKRALPAAVVALLVLAATAVAVTPIAGLYASNGEGGAGFTLKGKSIVKKAAAPSNFKCNKVNLVIPKSIPVRGGKFSFKGKVKTSPQGAKGTLTFKGHWTSATKVKGTSSLVRGSCKSGTVKFTATLLPSVP